MTSSGLLNKTPLYERHKQLGARMAAFGGWDMPIEYSGIIAEHLAVRHAAGLFDVSHMGQILIDGPEALALVQAVTSNDASRLQDRQIQYSALLYPEGTFIDDILVHRLAATSYLLCVNASNTEKDFQWILAQNHFKSIVTDVSQQYAQLALQGPKALAILQGLVNLDLERIKYYWLGSGHLQGTECLFTRTGYTGEDGFEVYCAPEKAAELWDVLLRTGKPYGLIPAGLGARNTLRLEAKMALYGHEISDQITPWEADLDWIVKLNKGAFVGREALVAQKQAGIQKILVGFEMTGRGIGRDGYPVLIGSQEAGYVTSGGPAPFLKKNIGLAYVPTAQNQVGTSLEIQVRSQRCPAIVVETPFYRRQRIDS
ncbi:MAG: glycine cleavage system aminomethyltransferase GcvT [Terriglobia bacterium]